MTPFSALLSVYYKEKPLFLGQCLDSILGQTVPASEIVLVKDGPLNPELDALIDRYIAQSPGLYKVFPTGQQVWLGAALAMGLQKCTHEIVARVDTDDISLPDRFEKQLQYLEQHPEIDVISGTMEEFNSEIGDLKRYKTVPETHSEIMKYAKYRNPVNHPAVMFRKSAALKVGSYPSTVFLEDYFLWVRMLVKGSVFYNMKDLLVYARVGNNMVGRRQGIRYFRDEKRFWREALDTGFISRGHYCLMLVLRLPMRFIPTWLLSLIYKIALRKS